MVLNLNILSVIKSKSGLAFDKAKDFETLSTLIYDATKRNIGVTTLKRLFGYISDSRNANEYTLNTIALYLGHSSWNELCSSFRVDSDWNYDDGKVYIQDLEIGQQLKIRYLDRELLLIVVERNKVKSLKVQESLNSSLQAGDVLLINTLEVGKIVEAKEVYRGTQVGNYRTNGELTIIEFVN